MDAVKTVRHVGAAALVLPALDHLIAPTLTILFAPGIMSSMFGEAGAIPTIVFFVALGLFQLLWIWVLLKSKNRSLMIVGAFVNMAAIALYFVSASGFTIPPFGVPPQPLAAFPVLVMLLEGMFVLASAYVWKALGQTSE